MRINVPHIFTRQFPYLEKVEFFRKVLYLFMLFNALTLLPIVEDLYGYYGLVGTKGWDVHVPIHLQGTRALINVLNHPSNSVYYWVYIVFVVAQIIFLITGLLNKWPRFSALMIYFLTINLHMKGYLAFTAGEVLLNMVLFYLLFISKPKANGLWGELQNVLNNTFYWILILQICLLYFFSGAYKLYDVHWQDGTAIQYVAKIDAYSSPLLYIFRENYWLSAIATYFALAYQLFFPVAVWIRKIKIPYLIFGVFFHLFIAFGMGIFYFGWIMIVMYLLFLDEKHMAWIRSKLSRKIKTKVAD